MMICAVSILLVCVPFAIAQEILQAPESTVVFLDQSAVFTCETDGGGLTGWRVNGIILQSLPPEIRSDLLSSGTNTDEGTVVEELTIPARAEYNGTRVQCLVGIFGGSSDESENATLRIQGPPSAVVNLKATSDSTSITISWEAPWSLDVTGVDPDIWYSVLVQNVTDENNPTPISCTDCTNITETVYTFTPDHLSPCHVYNFSVTPFNGAGQGESSHNETTKTFCLTRTDIKAVCDDVTVTFQIVGVDDFILRGISQVDIKNVSHSDSGFITYKISANKNYSIFFTIAGDINTSHDTFTTYDVQSVSVVEERDGVVVTGEFITDSRAAGCLLVLQGPSSSSSSSPDIFRTLQRTQLEQGSTIRVPPSTYTVYGYDIEEDWLPSTMPAVVMDDQISIQSDYNATEKTSPLLKSANLSRSDSTIVVDCQFTETHPKASCVLVYREYDSPLLTVIDIPQFFDFPVSITVECPENYTFALFGKDSVLGMEEEPIARVKFTRPRKTSPDGETDNGEEGKNSSQAKITQVVVISISMTLVVCALACGAAVLGLLVFRRYCRHKRAGPNGRNVVYDEVVLPPTSSSSSTVIPTEPNAAYATTTRVARHHHSS